MQDQSIGNLFNLTGSGTVGVTKREGLLDLDCVEKKIMSDVDGTLNYLFDDVENATDHKECNYSNDVIKAEGSYDECRDHGVSYQACNGQLNNTQHESNGNLLTLAQRQDVCEYSDNKLILDVQIALDYITEAVENVINHSYSYNLKETGNSHNRSCLSEYRDSGGEMGKDEELFEGKECTNGTISDSDESLSDSEDHAQISITQLHDPPSCNGNHGDRESIRAQGELFPEELPALENLKITVDERVELVEFGVVSGIVDTLVVIKSLPGIPALDEDSILFTDSRVSLGAIFEIFGPVVEPSYVVRFNTKADIKQDGVEIGMRVYCALREDQYTNFVFMSQLKQMKGSDASWVGDVEPPQQCLDYSDDDEERLVKGKKREKRASARGRTRSSHGGAATQIVSTNNNGFLRSIKPKHDKRPLSQYAQKPLKQWPPENQWPPSNRGPLTQTQPLFFPRDKTFFQQDFGNRFDGPRHNFPCEDALKNGSWSSDQKQFAPNPESRNPFNVAPVSNVTQARQMLVHEPFCRQPLPLACPTVPRPYRPFCGPFNGPCNGAGFHGGFARQPPRQNVPHNYPPPRQNGPQNHPPPRQNVPQNHPPPRQNVPQNHPPPRQNVPQNHPPPRQNVPQNHPPPRQNVPQNHPVLHPDVHQYYPMVDRRFVQSNPNQGFGPPVFGKNPDVK